MAMEKVHFFVKRDTHGEKIIHSICRTSSSAKFVFPAELRDPNAHPEGIANKVLQTRYKKKQHIPYVLKGSEVSVYLDVTNGKFHFKGQKLKEVPALGVSNDPSIEKSDESDGSSDDSDYESNTSGRDCRLNETLVFNDSRTRTRANDARIVMNPRSYCSGISSNLDNQPAVESKGNRRKSQLDRTFTQQDLTIDPIPGSSKFDHWLPSDDHSVYSKKSSWLNQQNILHRTQQKITQGKQLIQICYFYFPLLLV